MKQSKNLIDVIGDKDNILIISSIPVDVDALASGAILKNYLKSYGKKVTLTCSGKLSLERRKIYSFLPYIADIKFADSWEALRRVQPTVLILIDSSTFEQFSL